MTQPVSIPTRGGEHVARIASFIPLPSVTNKELHVLCVWLPAAANVAQPTASEPSRLHAELAAVRDRLRSQYHFDQVVARHPAMLRAVQQARLAAEAGVGVHLHGPNGSGREFLARVIHQSGPRRLRPFVPLDCAVLTPCELKRTLERAFRAPPPDAPLELEPGAILLRNVVTLPRDIQQSLLELWPAEAPASERVPWVHALDAVPLAEALADDRLLPELYYRLTAVVIDLPPLRDRGDDLALLAQFCVERLNRTSDVQRSGFSSEALALLRQYNWPGNVRELRAVVNAAHAAATGPAIHPPDLPFRFRTGMDAQRVVAPRGAVAIDLAAHLREIETHEIRRVLALCRENRAKAARLLGLTRTKLYRRMEQLGIDASPTTD